ncbi:MAG TPA: Na+/H+ antiporter [Pseudomonadota bacterium]|nr:Na+/H+ antiporter [Pseudomonadota bacterium]
MQFEAVFVTLFAVASAVALAARWLKVPYTVALVVAGLVLGTVRAIEPPHLTKELLYALFLPGLVFEAAFHLDFQKFWQNKLAIHSLAVPGVAAAIGLTAILLHPVANALHFVDGFSFQHALVFAALIAATDPIAVVALFKSLGAPKRLAVLVEGESLLNDGTAVVFFTLILAMVSGGSSSLVGAAIDFVRVVGLGTAVGVVIGYGASKLTQRVDDPMIEITLTTIAAYGSFILAEHFHLSGVIATVAAGMLCGNYGARTGMSPSTRIAVESFWEYIAFALNSIVFLLIGFEVRLSGLLASWKPILVAYLAVTVGRAALIYLATLLLRRTRETLPWSWAAVLTWGGLRGGLSMVLALALPRDFPHRELLVTMTFGVVILSILSQGLSMGPLLRRLGLVGLRAERRDYEHERGILRTKTAALSALDQLVKEGTVHAEAVAQIRDEYGRQIVDAEQRIKDMHLQADELRTEEQHAARRQLLLVEKDTLLSALRKGHLSQEVHDALLADVDARLLQLDSH